MRSLSKSLSICIRGGCKMIFCPPALGKHSSLPFSSEGRLRTKELGGREESRKRPFPLSSFDKKRGRFCSALPYCSVLYSVYTHWIQHCWKTKGTNCMSSRYATAYMSLQDKKNLATFEHSSKICTSAEVV